MFGESVNIDLPVMASHRRVERRPAGYHPPVAGPLSIREEMPIPNHNDGRSRSIDQLAFLARHTIARLVILINE